jgi:hypothetical protein
LRHASSITNRNADQDARCYPNVKA